MRIDLDGVTTLLYQGKWAVKPFWFTDNITWQHYRFLIDLYNCRDF